jgi:hypothetical protein
MRVYRLEFPASVSTHMSNPPIVRLMQPGASVC